MTCKHIHLRKRPFFNLFLSFAQPKAVYIRKEQPEDFGISCWLCLFLIYAGLCNRIDIVDQLCNGGAFRFLHCLALHDSS